MADVLREFKLPPEQCSIVASALREYGARFYGSMSGDVMLEKHRQTCLALQQAFERGAGLTPAEAGVSVIFSFGDEPGESQGG